MARIEILVYAPTSVGGLAEHVFYQCRTLARSGARLNCLAAPDFLGGRPCEFTLTRCLRRQPAARGSRWLNRLATGITLIANQFILAWAVLRHRPKLVLLDSYVEYLAPAWIWPHVVLHRCLGIHYVANLHDPVRSYRIGPPWWHALSVGAAYLPLSTVLIHAAPAEPSPIPPRLRVVQVPVGVYDLLPPTRSRESMRSTWGAGAGARVFLAFGYVRDGKNLDLAIRALAQVPEAFLVIAGSIASSHDRGFAFYEQLAIEMGVRKRVVLREGFVTDHDLANYFEGADFVLLTYASSFHSQSGVLNVAASARRPVLASSAPSPLLNAVRDYGLGVAIVPDQAPAVVEGMQSLINKDPQPRWTAYANYASWEANAQQILALLAVDRPTAQP